MMLGTKMPIRRRQMVKREADRRGARALTMNLMKMTMKKRRKRHRSKGEEEKAGIHLILAKWKRRKTSPLPAASA